MAGAILLIATVLLGGQGAGQALPADTVAFAPVADTYVDARFPSRSFDASRRLRAGAAPVRISFLRFNVSGLGARPVLAARLRLQVRGRSAASGGTIHLLSDAAWDASTLTYDHRPAVDGAGLATLGPVSAGAVVEFDLDGVIAGDGIYSLAIDSAAPDAVTYRSSAARTGQRPVLVLTVAGGAAPRVAIVQPPTGARFFVGDPITLQGTATDPVDGDLSDALEWSSDRDGPLGAGAVVASRLSPGSHTVTASVRDRAGLAGASTIGLTVSPAPPGNTPPLVVITAPANLAACSAAEATTFQGRADDLEDGDLSDRLAWTSDRDGLLGVGASIRAALSPGPHTITASATDSAGLSSEAGVTINVVSAPATLTAEATTTTLLRLPPRTTAPAATAAARPSTTPTVPAVSMTATAPMITAAASSTNVGFQDFSFGSHVDEIDNPATAHKPESKLWYNDGTWWATLFSPRNGGGHRIHRLDPALQTWVDTGVLVDGRARSRQDALWDGNKLYLASHYGYTGGTPQNRLMRYTYIPIWKTYVLDPGFPVKIPGGGTEAMTLAKDTTGTLWIAYTLDRRVFVDHTVGGDDTRWDKPFVVPVADGTTVSSDDIAGIIALPGKIGVFWSNQDKRKDYFAVHPDGTAATAAWSEEVAGQGGAFADDQLNMKLASDGRLFVAVKTSYNDVKNPPSDALVGLLVRSPTGAWSELSTVATVRFNPTRPICLLDEVDRLVYVFYSLDHSAIYYKTSSMDSIDFPSGSGTAFIKNSGVDDINDPTSTKQNVAPSTGLVVVASSPSATDYWHNAMALQPPPPTTTTTVSSTTSTTTTTTLPGSTLSFPPVADTYVDASVPTQVFGTAARLRADGSPTRQTFLRFAVSGVGSRPVSRAVVWLTVGSDSSAASDSGGTIHLITDNGWSEATTTYANRPAIDGPGLFPQGAVALDHVVAFDVTGAVTADGTYSFALDSASTNGVEYESREAAQGKPALVLTLGAVTSTTATTSTTTTTRPPGGSAVEVRVAASADDAEEHATGTIDLTSSDLELIHQSDDQTVGMRFVGLNIPRGATIRAAYIQFTVDEAQTEPTTLVIQGQAADSAPKFATTSGNVSARARTAAAVAWPSVPAWTTVGEAGSNQRSPDISAVVQEIVDRAGWTPGNALAIIITGGGHRTAKSFDGDRAAAPLLHVEY